MQSCMNIKQVCYLHMISLTGAFGGLAMYNRRLEDSDKVNSIENVLKK